MKIMKIGKWLLTPALALLALGPSKASASADTGGNVVLLTLDGVRWEEVFRGIDPGQSMDADTRIFDFLVGTLAKEGPLLGDKGRGEKVTVSNRQQNSLPAYQSIMAGATQPCSSNACGRIQVETFPERLVHDLGLKREQVAIVASWEKIAHAAEHAEGTTLVNAGLKPFAHPTGQDAETDALNKRQAEDVPPWGSARYDKYTFAHAMHVLKKHQPRFLFISLNDSDEWGHKGDYAKYVSTLRQHDAWIRELATTLDAMGEYGKRTTLIITTDHGRGEGNDWNEHGSGYANSGAVWLYGRSPRSRKLAPGTHRSLASQRGYSHLDIRPTIETLFGLKPKLDGVGELPGKAIQALVGPR